ncbi:glutamyl-tRNA amidotransferase [Copromyces sp. CBS 386.78]|nr:glutamyl-tRNA amidotransferase [Copromyces sp. CBS 386.78]
MPRIPTVELSRYLLTGHIASPACLGRTRAALPAGKNARAALPWRQQHLQPRLQQQQARYLTTETNTTTTNASTPPPPTAPFRKQLKEQAKALKKSGQKKKKSSDNQTVPGWELTVGIEIHAQLNTAHKLFSSATTSSFNDSPNTHVAPFDLALPGSQPLFQPATLVPAIRAALALNCSIQPVSRFDRKHYFHWDQPSGYQITQFYEPFAKDGYITLYARDGIAAEDGEEVKVGIKQVQMEQDTAKTTAQPGETQWLDFNRVGVPLIEIITLPEIHHPATAAALVRKVQMVLGSVDACVSGLEEGGLRADVNVSVRRTGESGLGQRTEIKNLSSFKAVEDAVIAERDRQIKLLESGGKVLGETRGWSLGSTETKRLRGKEGEVDYRYMPDPDLGPVVIGDDLVQRLKETMGTLPDAEADALMERYHLSAKDALALMLLDGGARVQYFYNVLDSLEERIAATAAEEGQGQAIPEKGAEHATLAANWCLHELGKLADSASSSESCSSGLEMTPQGESPLVPSSSLAAILFHLHSRSITAKVAKDLLWAVYRGEVPSSSSSSGDPSQGRRQDGITAYITTHNLWFKELSEAEYAKLADEVIQGEEKVLGEFVKWKQGKMKAYPQGKLMYLVGKMMRNGPEGRVEANGAERVLRAVLERWVEQSEGGQ